MMRLMITGHRPTKLGGYAPENPVARRVRTALRDTLATIHATTPEVVGITGMALGVDQWFAELCLDLGIPFEAFVPFAGQESRWPAPSQLRYRQLLAQAAAVHHPTLAPRDYDAVRQALLDRNTRMVDTCTHALAVWNGSPGGTADAVRKLQAAGRPLMILHPDHPQPAWPFASPAPTVRP